MNSYKTDGNVVLRQISDKAVSVAAKRTFKEGEVIEACPIVVLSERHSHFIEATSLVKLCHRIKRRLVLPGGYGPVYLPSEDPNAYSLINPEQRMLLIKANRRIKKGEFIHVNRGMDIGPVPEVEYNKWSGFRSDGLIVKESPGRGLGVFTTRRFRKGEFVEVCPAHTFNGREGHFVGETGLDEYVYEWGSFGVGAWPIGYPCFYNHSDEPNIYPFDTVETASLEHLAARALRNLQPNTELVFDYTGGAKKKNLHFEVR